MVRRVEKKKSRERERYDKRLGEGMKVKGELAREGERERERERERETG